LRPKRFRYPNDGVELTAGRAAVVCIRVDEALGKFPQARFLNERVDLYADTKSETDSTQLHKAQKPFLEAVRLFDVGSSTSASMQQINIVGLLATEEQCDLIKSMQKQGFDIRPELVKPSNQDKKRRNL
jgi:hypothetical protein